LRIFDEILVHSFIINNKRKTESKNHN